MSKSNNPVADPDENKSVNGPRPFSDTTGQSSQLLSVVIGKVKHPLLGIYDLGVLHNYSHWKHFPRVMEKIFLATKDAPLDLDFEERHIIKTLANCAEVIPPKDAQRIVSRHWKEILHELEDANALPGNNFERLIVGLASEFTSKFAGGKNPDIFHAEKIAVANTYNEFIKEQGTFVEMTQNASSELVEDIIPLARYAKLESLGIPLLPATK